jgi:hypothetical protein
MGRADTPLEVGGRRQQIKFAESHRENRSTASRDVRVRYEIASNLDVACHAQRPLRKSDQFDDNRL